LGSSLCSGIHRNLLLACTSTYLREAKMPPDEEMQLLKRARTYDQAALGELYDRYSGRIYNYVYHRVGDPSQAEELTAQVFLRVLEAVREDRAWRTSFSGWLYRIAHNLVIDHYRRRSRAVQVALEDAPVLPATRGDPEKAAERALNAEQLRMAIARLTKEQAQVVSLRFLEEMSIAEVAAVMGKSEGAIKALQYRAVLALRNLLETERN